MTTERELRQQEEEASQMLRGYNEPRTVKQNLVIVGVCVAIAIAVYILV